VLEVKKPMKVLIVNTNRNDNALPVMPVGACMVADAASRAGHHVRFFDAMFSRHPGDELRAQLNAFQPEVVGFSIRNIDNNDIQHPREYYKDMASLLADVYGSSKTRLVIGGAAVAVMPEALLRYTGASWAVVGDGETVFPQLLASISSQSSFKRIPHLAWIENNVFMKNDGPACREMSASPAPDFHRWLDARKYVRAASTVPLQSKRGCPARCIYCTYAAAEGSAYRLCPPEQVTEAVKRLVGWGFQDIEFVDNVFNAPYEHALAICESLAEAKTGARLHTIELNPMHMDDQLLNAMERAGFAGMGITAESASDGVLEGLGKDFRSEHVHKSAELIRRHNIPCLWIFLFGGPGETPATVKETLAFAGSRIRSEDAAFFNIGLRIYPGTRIERRARKEGTLNVAQNNMLTPVFYFSPGVKLEWLVAELNRAVSTHTNFLTPTTIGPSFLWLIKLVNRLGYRCGLRPPFWRYTSPIKRKLKMLGIRDDRS
jgi:radical SAM superfamily enzyme YgiQ (UPF0313 family)